MGELTAVLEPEFAQQTSTSTFVNRAIRLVHKRKCFNFSVFFGTEKTSYTMKHFLQLFLQSPDTFD